MLEYFFNFILWNKNVADTIYIIFNNNKERMKKNEIWWDIYKNLNRDKLIQKL
jgi:hypothetical protein